MSSKNTTKDDSLYSEMVINAIEKLSISEKAFDMAVQFYERAWDNLHEATNNLNFFSSASQTDYEKAKATYKNVTREWNEAYSNLNAARTNLKSLTR